MYAQKYLKYKNKYLQLKKQFGGKIYLQTQSDDAKIIYDKCITDNKPDCNESKKNYIEKLKIYRDSISDGSQEKINLTELLQSLEVPSIVKEEEVPSIVKEEELPSIVKEEEVPSIVKEKV
jgi:hypothetical protein